MQTDSNYFCRVVSGSFRHCTYKCSVFPLARERVELVTEGSGQLSIEVGRAVGEVDLDSRSSGNELSSSFSVSGERSLLQSSHKTWVRTIK